MTQNPAQTDLVLYKGSQRLLALANEPWFAPDQRIGPKGSLTVNEDHVRFRIWSGAIRYEFNSLQDCENLRLKHTAIIIQPEVKSKTEFPTAPWHPPNLDPSLCPWSTSAFHCALSGISIIKPGWNIALSFLRNFVPSSLRSIIFEQLREMCNRDDWEIRTRSHNYIAEWVISVLQRDFIGPKKTAPNEEDAS